MGRFIPARAGNSVWPASAMTWKTVHPRACGELQEADAAGAAYNGSSPRVRGTLALTPCGGNAPRFIPARAGNSPPPSDCTALRAVHPRACGELLGEEGIADVAAGSSPRVRGTHRATPDRLPRKRFIPARAGNSHAGDTARIMNPVHPRACGELRRDLDLLILLHGSSPRVRGTLHISVVCNPVVRFIPARAGNSCHCIISRLPMTVHPRACGELRFVAVAVDNDHGSSPRVRGTRAPPSRCPSTRRFIPARAGNSPPLLM